MRNLASFSANTVAQFDNNYDNMLEFNGILLDASHGIYTKYTKEETDTLIRTQFNRIMGVTDFKALTPMKRRQAWRMHEKEIASLIEDVIVDRMNSGWNESNAAFMKFVKELNIADGDQNEVYVEDDSLLVVSKFAGNHHDVVRQYCKPGKRYTIETSYYAIKVYADYEMFQLGRIDFPKMVDKMYQSIEQTRYAALYTAFMSADASIPTDLKITTAISDSTKDNIIDKIEAVKAATGKEVMLVGARPAIQKLQNSVNYNMFSDAMKDEKNQKGILGNWEGYECLALDRVNKAGTLESAFSAEDNKKIFIMPIDGEGFIYRVNEGDVIYTESGMDGMKKDMTVDAEIVYQEGIGVIVSEKFGLIQITA